MQRKGGIERFLEKKNLKLAITAAKESGEARKIVRNKKSCTEKTRFFVPYLKAAEL